MLQLPLATVLVQVSTPSLTSTLPVGVPLPVGTTVNLTITVCPLTEGSGPSEVIVVVVSVLLTVTLSLQPLFPSAPSVMLLLGSTLQLPPLRGFANAPVAVGVAVKETSNEPYVVPSVTGQPFAVQVGLLLRMTEW